jgi:hypothetical protein
LDNDGKQSRQTNENAKDAFLTAMMNDDECYGSGERWSFLLLALFSTTMTNREQDSIYCG